MLRRARSADVYLFIPCSRFASSRLDATPGKWTPVFGPELRQNKALERFIDSVKREPLWKTMPDQAAGDAIAVTIRS
jgi:hypothetical protein